MQMAQVIKSDKKVKLMHLKDKSLHNQMNDMKL